MAVKNMFYNRALFSSRYIAGKHLGIGSTSTVFECYNRITRNKFAAKETIMNDIHRFNHYKKEEQILGMLSNHPNICSIHDLFYHNDKNNQYIKHIITDCGDDTLGNLAPKIALNEYYLKIIVKQMLEAIFFCHTNNICHRDIKLDNFIYTNSYNLSHNSPMFLNTISIKLIDFGLATNYQKDYNIKGKVGTNLYFAPEIFTNFSYTINIDAWSLGVSIYKLIIGNPKIRYNKLTYFTPNYSDPKWNHYSPECINFIQQLLTVDTKQRMSIKDAFNHQWITGA